MNKYSFLLALVMLITLTDISISSAQSKVQNGSQSTRAAQTTIIAEPITLETPSGTLYGTLEWPQSRSPVPVVLIIAGSGPTDRDGNSIILKGPNNSLKLLAEGLAARGIASVRYDKRGVGETGRAMQLASEKAKTMQETGKAQIGLGVEITSNKDTKVTLYVLPANPTPENLFGIIRVPGDQVVRSQAGEIISCFKFVPRIEDNALRIEVFALVGNRERAIVSYLAKRGETVRVSEASQFGVEPFEMKIVDARTIPAPQSVPAFRFSPPTLSPNVPNYRPNVPNYKPNRN